MCGARITPEGSTKVENLEVALRRYAEGGLCTEAAVELLIEHRSWLERVEFVSTFVEVLDATGKAMAFVDWARAIEALESGEIPCSSSEGQLLRLAASIAMGVPVDLAAAVCGLDITNVGRVSRALAHAAGHRAHR